MTGLARWAAHFRAWPPDGVARWVDVATRLDEKGRAALAPLFAGAVAWLGGD